MALGPDNTLVWARYMRLIDPARNARKHYFVGVVSTKNPEGDLVYQVLGAWARIGTVPVSQVKYKTISYSEAVAQSWQLVKARTSPKQYVLMPIHESVGPGPYWWVTDRGDSLCGGDVSALEMEMEMPLRIIRRDAKWNF